MVVSYLEKIRDKFIEERVNYNTQLTLLLNEKKENTEIIKLLEINDDPNFEAFTPRQVNSFNKTKVMELKERQTVLDKEVEIYKENILQIDSEIEEITIVIKAAKDMQK